MESEPFTIVTDHVALKWLKTSKIPDGRRARWIMDLQQFTFDIKHRSGKSNANADGLSRMYEEKVNFVECFMMDMRYEDTGDLYSEISYQDEVESEWHYGHRDKEYHDDVDYLYYTPAYTYSHKELEYLHEAMIKEKQVIANQPITRGGSRCDFSCDIENHHVHTYCKGCQRNLPYGTTIHNCKCGTGIGKIHFNINPDFLINKPWWKEPDEVIEQNRQHYARYYKKNSEEYINTCQNGQRTFGKFVNLRQY